jgi:hypothetical protein
LGEGALKLERYEDSTDKCGDECDFYFKAIKIVDEYGCVLKEIEKTATTDNTADVDLTKVEELKDTKKFKVPTNRRVKIEAEVWDEDGGLNDDDKIRDISVEVPFDTITAGDWNDFNGGDSEWKLHFRYKLYCYSGFTGLGCNDPAPGNCTCDKKTGNNIFDDLNWYLI